MGSYLASMEILTSYIGKHPAIVPWGVSAVFLIMLIASVIRAFQRWEIIPDPLLPEKPRKVWYALQKALGDMFAAGLSGRR